MAAQLKLAGLHIARREFDKASVLLAKVIKADPKNGMAHAAPGQQHAAKCELAEAVPPRLLLARVYTVLGRPEEGEKQLKELESVAPDAPLAYQALGAYYESSGQREKAVTGFQSVLAAREGLKKTGRNGR